MMEDFVKKPTTIIIGILILTLTGVSIFGYFQYQQSVRLTKKVSVMEAEIEDLRDKANELEQLKKTPNYYYQKAVSHRRNEKYEKANEFLKELIERFPEHEMRKRAKNMLEQNERAKVKQYLDQAKELRKDNNYSQAMDQLKKLKSKFPNQKTYRTRTIGTNFLSVL